MTRHKACIAVLALASLGLGACSVSVGWDEGTGSVSSAELLIAPIGDPTVVQSEPYQYTSTWTDESGNVYEHTTITNSDYSTVDLHYINGALVGTLYSDVDGNWTYTDGSGQLVYADRWNEETGVYDVVYGSYATWEDFDALVLEPLSFWSGPSGYYDVMTLESGGGAVYMLASADGTPTGAAPVYTVSTATKGVLVALSKLGSKAPPTAFVQLLKQLSKEPRAPKSAVAQQKRAAGQAKRQGPK